MAMAVGGSKGGPRADINMTPLIDVLLVLLIIFMIITPMLQAGVIRDALTVPDAAVLRDTENMPFVYSQSGANQFARRLVKIGDSQGGRTQITDGLREGERVVSDGSLFLQFKNSLQH